MKKSKKIEPQQGQMWLTSSNEPFIITGYDEVKKVFWCKNLVTGNNWGTGIGAFENGDYKPVKIKKSEIIRQQEDYIVCLENEISELKSKLNNKPQGTQSNPFEDFNEIMHQVINKEVQKKRVSKFGRIRLEYHNAIQNLLKSLYELQTVVEGNISCQIFERISENENHNHTTDAPIAHGTRQCNNHKAHDGTQCSDFCINNQKGQYKVLFRFQTYLRSKNHQKLSDKF